MVEKDTDGKDVLREPTSGTAQTYSLKKEPMPWDHWWNGQKGGVLESWTVTYFPTIYVFDPKGMIRYKNLNPKQLDEAVEKTLNAK